MDPQQAPIAPGDNPYHFIINPEKPQKQTMLKKLLGGSSLLIKVALGGIGVLFLLIVGSIVANIFFSAPSNVEEIVVVAQTETEIARIARQSSPALDQNVKNAAANTASTVESHKQHWLIFLSRHSRKATQKELQQKASANTDHQLAQAGTSNTYDTTFANILRAELTSYAAALKNAYNNAGDAAEKASLQDQYSQVQLLLQQWTK